MISWWWLIPAFAVGVFAGVSTIICLCCAAREADREIEEFTRRIEEAGRF